MSTCHCGTNMTEVAQVVAAVAHDVDDVENENEHKMSDAENKEDDVTHEEEDVAVNEKDAAEEESEKTSHTEDKKPCQKTDEGSNEADKTYMNGVEHKEDDTADDDKNEKSAAVNGVEKDTENKENAEPDINDDPNISELELKKEVRQEYKMKNSIFYLCIFNNAPHSLPLAT